jgi:hypothetical protein
MIVHGPSYPFNNRNIQLSRVTVYRTYEGIRLKTIDPK